jgi:parallel beta-helix repeat protein
MQRAYGLEAVNSRSRLIGPRLARRLLEYFRLKINQHNNEEGDAMTTSTSRAWGIWVAVVVAAQTPVFAAESVERCSSCADCTTKLASGAYDTVLLDTDIVDHAGDCIDLSSGTSNVVFDCGGRLIDGDELGIDPVRGISVMHGSGNTVRNCRVSDFDSGIFVVNGIGMAIEHNILTSNRVGIDLSHADSNLINGNTVRESSTGIKISNSDNNTFSGNVVCDNFPWDFYLASGTSNVGLDNICDITWFWNDFETTDCMLSCTIFDCGFESGNFDDWSSLDF